MSSLLWDGQVGPSSETVLNASSHLQRGAAERISLLHKGSAVEAHPWGEVTALPALWPKLAVRARRGDAYVCRQKILESSVCSCESESVQKRYKRNEPYQQSGSPQAPGAPQCARALTVRPQNKGTHNTDERPGARPGRPQQSGLVRAPIQALASAHKQCSTLLPGPSATIFPTARTHDAGTHPSWPQALRRWGPWARGWTRGPSS